MILLIEPPATDLSYKNPADSLSVDLGLASGDWLEFGSERDLEQRHR